MSNTLEKTYTRKEVLDIVQYIKRQPILVTLNFPERELAIYSGNWKFKYPDDIKNKIENS